MEEKKENIIIEEKKKYAAQRKYDKNNTKYFGLKLNKHTDKDILDWLESQNSKQGAIKKAIEYYINHCECSQ